VTTNPRISGFSDAGYLVDEDAKMLTADGRPWLRWVNHDGVAGWYHLGTRQPARSESPGFWEVVFREAVELASWRVDSVHCIGSGILSVGGMGITLVGGYAAALLCECLLTDPIYWVQTMAGIIKDVGVYPTSLHGQATDHAECYFSEVEGAPLIHVEQMVSMVRGDDYAKLGNKWSSAGKRRAKLWVESIGRLLALPTMDAAQVAFCKKHVPGMLSDRARERIGWPSGGADDCWQYTREQQALWVVVMIATMLSSDATEKMVLEHVGANPPNAKKSLLSIFMWGIERTVVRVDMLDTEQVFISRVLGAIGGVQNIYGFKVEEQ
jgi:hypothetical protein